MPIDRLYAKNAGAIFDRDDTIFVILSATKWSRRILKARFLHVGRNDSNFVILSVTKWSRRI